MSVIITNIQRSSFHDGNGIRTTVFLKGCTLHCPWCANPENISTNKEYYLEEKNCIKENLTCMCNRNCPILSSCTDYSSVSCPVGAIEKIGEEYTQEDLYYELLKDKVYYSTTNGGITFSGGEPLLQLYKLENLLQRLKQEKINTTVETSLFCPEKNLTKIIEYISFYYVDVKSLEKSIVENVLGGKIELFFQNLDLLFKCSENIVFRLPLVKDITVTDNSLKLLDSFLSNYKPLRVEFFNVHELGKEKYKKLKKQFIHFEEIDNKYKESLKAICLKNNISCKELEIG